MFRGPNIVLRPRHESDISILHRELYEDVRTRVRTDSSPWRPRPDTDSPFREKTEASDRDRVAVFTVADPETDEPLGACLLWGIDYFNRNAHIGMSLRPVARGRGLARETVQLLSEYAFEILGLQRLGIETLTDNEAMVRAALGAGFSREGTLRQAGWVNGRWADEAIFGLLADEWRRLQ